MLNIKNILLNMNVLELKELLKEYNLKVFGKKTDLVNRLLNFFKYNKYKLNTFMKKNMKRNKRKRSRSFSIINTNNKKSRSESPGYTNNMFNILLEKSLNKENELANKLRYSKKNPEEYIKDEDLIKLNTLDGVLLLIKKYKNINNLDVQKLILLQPELEELSNMIGLNKIKNIIVSQIIYLIQKLNKDEEMMHTVLYGEPGTGKTMLAKILAKIYLKLDFVKNNKFIIANRSDLIAGFLGQTAIKTQKLINKAKGGVLFIDEAYSLGSNNNGSDSFAKECIDTLVHNLSEKKDFICIIAGYKNELERCFFSQNKGLERRFPWAYNIPSLSYEDLKKIFILMVRKEKLDINENDIPDNFFKNNKQFFKYNGGSIETFITKIRMIHSKRVFGKPKDIKNKVIKVDITRAFEIHKNFKTISKKKVPFGIYL